MYRTPKGNAFSQGARFLALPRHSQAGPQSRAAWLSHCFGKLALPLKFWKDFRGNSELLYNNIRTNNKNNKKDMFRGKASPKLASQRHFTAPLHLTWHPHPTLSVLVLIPAPFLHSSYQQLRQSRVRLLILLSRGFASQTQAH